jgi:hypothetical protein
VMRTARPLPHCRISASIKLTIENGTVVLPPSGGKPGKQIGAVMLQASLPSINDPAQFDAKGVLDGQ